MTVTAFSSIEKALLNLLVRDYEPLDIDHIGGDFAFDSSTQDWYVRIERDPGGKTDRLEGDFVLAVEVFSSDYSEAENVSSDLGALLVDYPHTVEVDGRRVTIDKVSQNAGIASLPWESDFEHRLGASYVLTARRR